MESSLRLRRIRISFPSLGTASLVSVLLVIEGCSSDRPPSNGNAYVRWEGDSSSDERDAGLVGAIEAGDGGTVHDAFMGNGASKSVELADAAVVEISPDKCVNAEGNATRVQAPVLWSGFDQLGKLGNRHFAFGSADLALMLFTLDGAAAPPAVWDMSSVGAYGDTLMTVFSSREETHIQRYNAWAAVDGPAVEVARGPISGVSVTIGPTHAATVWCSSGSIQGALTPVGGGPSSAFDLGAGSAGGTQCKTAGVWNGEAFSIAWTRTLHNMQSKTSFVRVDTSGGWNVAKLMVESSDAQQLMGIAKLTIGHVVLVNQGRPSKSTLVLRVDDWGNSLGPVYRLAGAPFARSVVAEGDYYGVVASLDDRRGAFRSFHESGAPAGPWVCVQDSGSAAGTAYTLGIVPEGQGYGVLASMQDGSVWYRVLDRSGKGAH